MLKRNKIWSKHLEQKSPSAFRQGQLRNEGRQSENAKQDLSEIQAGEIKADLVIIPSVVLFPWRGVGRIVVGHRHRRGVETIVFEDSTASVTYSTWNKSWIKDTHF